MDEPIFPQRPTEARAEILSVEWLFEPLWPGTRVVARVIDGRATLTDELAQPAGDELSEAAELIGPAVLARQAVVDGVWTAQPFVGDGSPARQWADTLEQEGLAEEVPNPIEVVRRRAFVAVDLLELDDEPLLDVPLQERRRLLESVIDETVQVRVSPSVKLPVEGWVEGWRANGFTHYLAKHQNSRYLIGERNDDWLKLSLRADAPRSMFGRIVGMARGERIRRIRD